MLLLGKQEGRARAVFRNKQRKRRGSLWKTTPWGHIIPLPCPRNWSWNPNLQSAHQTNERKEKSKRKKRNHISGEQHKAPHIRQAERRRNKQQEWWR
jgi:hypothetical protein